MDHGYEFSWTPGKLPVFISPSGKVVTLQVDHYVPFLQVAPQYACPAPHGEEEDQAADAEIDAALQEYEMSDGEGSPLAPPINADEDADGTAIDFARPRVPLAGVERDRWEPRGNWLVRVHVDPRLDLFAPSTDDVAIKEFPIFPALLDGVARQT